MRVAEVSRLPALERLVYWIKERHAVFLRKGAGKPKPWTDDEIIQSTYFTNPYRENDKVTRWVKKNISDNPAFQWAHGPQVVWFAVLAFRWFNYIPTGELLLGQDGSYNWRNLLLEWDTKEAVRRLRNERDCGRQVFTGAFNISNGGSRKSKVLRVCEDYIQPAWDNRFEYGKAWDDSVTLEGVHASLSVLPGMGGSGFMAAQVIADLKHTPFLRQASDWWTWSSPGPGSLRGMQILLDEQGKGVRATKRNWQALMDGLRPKVNASLTRGKPSMPQLCAQDLQNCLCEYSKYERCRNGDGRSKRTYQGV